MYGPSVFSLRQADGRRTSLAGPPEEAAWRSQRLGTVDRESLDEDSRCASKLREGLQSDPIFEPDRETRGSQERKVRTMARTADPLATCLKTMLASALAVAVAGCVSTPVFGPKPVAQTNTLDRSAVIHPLALGPTLEERIL